MTKREFNNKVKTMADLFDFCNSLPSNIGSKIKHYTLHDVYKGAELDSIIEEDIAHYLSSNGWQDLSEVLFHDVFEGFEENEYYIHHGTLSYLLMNETEFEFLRDMVYWVLIGMEEVK